MPSGRLHEWLPGAAARSVEATETQDPEGGAEMAESKGGGHASVWHGEIWAIGWLFTIAYGQLPWWKALVGAVLWPYFLGTAAR